MQHRLARAVRVRLRFTPQRRSGIAWRDVCELIPNPSVDGVLTKN